MNDWQLNGPVLVLDDEKNIVTVLAAMLMKRGYFAEGFSSPKSALKALSNKKYMAVITDLQMPEMDGMSFLREVRQVHPQLPVIMITAYGTVDSAVSAIKQGAFDYVTKPFEQSEICLVVQKAINHYQMSIGDATVSESNDTIFSPLFSGVAMEKNRRLIEKIAPGLSTVLIRGEAGTGKELVAQEIHRRSARAQHALIKFNCATVIASQMEEELFGTRKVGRWDLSRGATLFVDEIQEMPLECQTLLLQQLESQGASPAVGDVRLIVGTTCDLGELVRIGTFSEELLYKLNVVTISLPALRERRADLAGILDFFVQRIALRVGRGKVEMAEDMRDFLLQAHWPGNLRQMEQVIERLILLSEGAKISLADLSEDSKKEIGALSGDSLRFKDIIKKRTQDLEKELIERALSESNGNVTRTAEQLGLSRKGLQLKMKELGIK